MSVASEARKNAVVDDLYLEIDAVTPITVSEIDGVHWSSTTQMGTTNIEAGRDAKRLDAAMYHELLHAKMKVEGHCQYSLSVTTNVFGFNLRHVLEALDNELQHHRMFAQFDAAGFQSKDFYNDEDASAFRGIRQDLKKMDGSDSLVDYFFKFLTVIAPGGQATADERANLKSFLFSRCGPEKRASLEAIEADFDQWASGIESDPGTVLEKILTKLGFNGVWVGRSKNFPDDGFFIGPSFTADRALLPS